MATLESIRHELNSRFADAGLMKSHISLRYEPAPKLVRLGACIEPYNLATRAAVLDRILDFEEDHEDDFAIEFDIVPHGPVMDREYAEA